MSDNAKVSLVVSENWRGLYVNGKLTFQDHSIDEYDMLDLLHGVGKFKFERLTAYDYAECMPDGYLNDRLSKQKLDEGEKSKFFPYKG